MSNKLHRLVTQALKNAQGLKNSKLYPWKAAMTEEDRQLWQECRRPGPVRRCPLCHASLKHGKNPKMVG